jgi:hypothetical protein
VAGILSRFTKGGCDVVTSGWSRSLTSDSACVRRCMLRPMGVGEGWTVVFDKNTHHIGLGWLQGGFVLCRKRHHL